MTVCDTVGHDVCEVVSFLDYGSVLELKATNPTKSANPGSEEGEKGCSC